MSSSLSVPETPKSPSARPGVLSMTISSKSTLYAAYMPHLKHGGLFIPGNRPYNLGDEVFVLLSLMDDKSRFPVAGRVAWVTPPGAQNSRSQGVGIHFHDDEAGRELKAKIETLLGGLLQSSRPTHTL